MNPRVFISSTFYDLKYAREDLGAFIRSFGFEDIRSESGNIGYTPGKPLDESCYSAMRESDMAVLIVGGRYGSPVFDEEPTSDAFAKFTSITCREFRTAVDNKIPIFVFIEESVNNEYQFYKKNKQIIEGRTINLDFSSVDSVNIFRFIESIKSIPTISIFGFKKVSDIKDTLKNQWADLFRKFLQSLKQQTVVIREVEPTISQVYNELQEMKVMLQKIGETTFVNDPEELEAIQDQQSVQSAAGKIASSFEFLSNLHNRSEIQNYISFFVEQLYVAKRQNLLENPFSPDPEDVQRFYQLFNYENVYISSVKEHLAFEEELFRDSEAFIAQLKERLGQQDYLKRMKFL